MEGSTVQHSKCQKVQLDPNSPKVEVANRNWPQMDKRSFYLRIVGDLGNLYNSTTERVFKTLSLGYGIFV